MGSNKFIREKKMFKKRITRPNPSNIVKMPLDADLQESLFAKYMGNRYSTREIRLNKTHARFQKALIFDALSD